MAGPNKIALYKDDLQTLQTITQYVIPAGGGATFAVSNNIATITTNAAHGLTFSTASGTPPNYFVSFGGSTSALTGTGILVGNFFRILSIPSTTTFTIYTTITAATVTSLTTIPIFPTPFLASSQSQWAGGPNAGASSPYTYYPVPLLDACVVNYALGANLLGQWNSDGTFVFLDQTTGSTPATAPVMKTFAAVSTNGQAWCPPTSTVFAASGSTATSYVQCYN